MNHEEPKIIDLGKALRDAAEGRVYQQTDSDCMRACVATYFRVDLDEVPELHTESWMDRLRNWLAPRGLGFASCTVTQEAWPVLCENAILIVAGESPRGAQHAVIYRDGKLWHDPHPDGGGIKQVESVDLFYPLQPPRRGGAS